MSARLFVALAAAIMLCGCSSVEMVKTNGGEHAFRDVNRAVRGKVVRMELRDGRALHVVGLHFSPDSVSWVDRRMNRVESEPTWNVQEVSIHKTGAGAFRGLLFGAVVGAAAGGVRAAIEGDDPTSDPLAISQEEKLRVYPAAHALYASLATTPLGAMIGAKKVYRFNSAGFPSEVTAR